MRIRCYCPPASEPMTIVRAAALHVRVGGVVDVALSFRFAVGAGVGAISV